MLEDGFFRSGDLGEWTSGGVKLSGRIDGVFKLENGEKVSSGEVEARMLAATPLLEQALVLGAGQTFVTALDTMFGGFRERADDTYRLLQTPGTAFLVIAAPEPDALRAV